MNFVSSALSSSFLERNRRENKDDFCERASCVASDGSDEGFVFEGIDESSTLLCPLLVLASGLLGEEGLVSSELGASAVVIVKKRFVRA